MYNRYIPQPDGSYRRSAVQDHAPKPQQPPPPEPCIQQPPEPPPRPERHPPRHPPAGSNVGGFLRHLLPKDFDTSDLFVVLLLLLMAGDCEEEQNTALLTLALYLFL